MQRIIRASLALCLCLSFIIGSFLPGAVVSAAPVQAIPAPIAGAPRPTIILTPAHGVPGATIQVSGEAVASLPGVRVVWLLEESTYTAAVVERRADNTYQAEVTVPIEIAPGTIQLCAAATETPLAAFACADFIVDQLPPGTVTAQFPRPAQPANTVPAALNAQLTLFNKSGIPVASAPFDANGAVTVQNVPPGTYNAAVVGFVPTLVENVRVTVGGGGAVTVPLTPAVGCYSSQVSAVRLLPSGPATDTYDFGPFIANSAVSIPLTLQADLQIVEGSSVRQVIWKTEKFGINTFADSPLNFTTFQAHPDISNALFDYDAVAGIETLTVTPQASFGDECPGLPTTRSIFLINNPFEINPFTTDIRDRSYNPLGWNGNGYDFELKLPSNFDYDYMNSEFEYDYSYVPDLPFIFPKPAPEFPLVGKLTNSLHLGLIAKGTIGVDGSVNFELMQARYRATIFGTGPYSDDVDLMPEGLGGGQLPATQRFLVAASPENIEATRNLIIDQLREMYSFSLEETIAEFDEEIPVLSTVLVNNPPLVIVTLGVSMGIKGEFVLKGSIKPLVPSFALDLQAGVKPRVSLDLSIIVALGLAQGGAQAITQGELSVPVRLTTSGNPPVSSIDPCFRISIIARIWYRLLFASWDSTETIADYQNGSCSGSPAIAQSGLPPLPNVFAAPSIAAAPDGRKLMAYVADTTTTPAEPAVQVQARFQDSDSDEWGEPFLISDGTHPVNSPVVVFAGASHTPMIVWVETVVSRAEAAALADDQVAVVQRQELYYSAWDGTAWGTPVRLTTDAFGDGAPALAGDALGATLVWVRNVSPDVTKEGSQIAVMNWTGGSWGPLGVVPTAATKLNTQVDVARIPLDASHAREMVIWTADSDGDLNTPNDRTLAIVRRDDLGSNWSDESVSELPSGVDMPSIAVAPNDPERAYAAFMVRGVNQDGSAAGFGNQSAVWTASRDASGVWSGAVLQDTSGESVHGERPRIGVGAAGEPLLLMRRFGETGTNAELGQVALTQLQEDGTAAPPIYLTDSPQQQWQQALAIDPTTGEALAVSVERAPALANQVEAAALLGPAVRGAMSETPLVILATADDPINVRSVGTDADPALDPDLSFSELYPSAGAMVVVSATVRNMGRSAVQPSVNFYRGAPATGELLQSVVVPVPLNFNESYVVEISVAADGGVQTFSAEVVAASNTSIVNDGASGTLGVLPPPALPRATPLNGVNAIQLSWQPLDANGVGGYRIYRLGDNRDSDSVVGETTNSAFTDVLMDQELKKDAEYCYIVRVYDNAGVHSGPSNIACTRLNPTVYTLYLPTALR